ncbi:MAG TPA: ribonuclease P protein component [Longimicrobiales bacterium]|nr:ribonuclease P protein component [Longimicrobiales bacterium]
MGGGTPDGGQSLPRARRLTRGSEIRAVFKRGKRSGTAHLDVFDSPSPLSRLRVGVVVPRYGHAAVARNLVKRRLREVLRRDLLPRLLAAGVSLDLIVRARREAYDADYGELREELNQLAERRWLRGASSS